MGMRQFYLNRHIDESGVSGVGRVAMGAILPSGKVIMEWMVKPCAVGLYDSIEDLIKIHGHNGQTIIEYS